MTVQEVQALSLAIAKANGHSDAEGWSRSVMAFWVEPMTPAPAAAEPAMFAPVSKSKE
jgi:hypothetical protein